MNSPATKLSLTPAAPATGLGQNWKCPYCGMSQVLLDTRYDKDKVKIKADTSVHGKTALVYDARVCANDDCKQMSLQIRLAERQDISDGLGTFTPGKAIREWDLYPTPPPEKVLSSKIGIPEPVRADYATAQALRTACPPASALYARRALSGMLSDYCRVTADKLSAQISIVRAKVKFGRAPEWCGGFADIDRVCKTGMIGKHMEAGLDRMTPVEPDEVDLLIRLLDQLAEDWFAVRRRRLERSGGTDCCTTPPTSLSLFERLWRFFFGG